MFCFFNRSFNGYFHRSFYVYFYGYFRPFLSVISAVLFSLTFGYFNVDLPFFNHYDRPYYNFIGHFWLCLFKYRFDFLAISKTEFLMSRNEIFYQNFFYLATYWILAYIFNCQIHIRMFIWSQIFENFENFKKMITFG